jgi:hypothetical protein
MLLPCWPKTGLTSTVFYPRNALSLVSASMASNIDTSAALAAFGNAYTEKRQELEGDSQQQHGQGSRLHNALVGRK